MEVLLLVIGNKIGQHIEFYMSFSLLIFDDVGVLPKHLNALQKGVIFLQVNQIEKP